VTGQITAADITEIQAQWFTTITNNGFGGEKEAQPSAASIRTTVEQAGLKYVHLPIGLGNPTEDVLYKASVMPLATVQEWL
jgi:uncharacterized protein (TIGR01244 family)